MRPHRCIAPLVLIVAACAAPDVHDPDDPTTLRRPFSTEDLRDEWTPGLRVVMERWSPDTGTSRSTLQVVESDDEAVVLDAFASDAEGNAISQPQRMRLTWTELRDHARYPADAAKLDEVTVDTPLGRKDCWRYQVEAPGGVRDEYLFAKGLPGPPVLHESYAGDRCVLRVTQIARQRD